MILIALVTLSGSAPLGRDLSPWLTENPCLAPHPRWNETLQGGKCLVSMPMRDLAFFGKAAMRYADLQRELREAWGWREQSLYIDFDTAPVDPRSGPAAL